ncbi:MAG: hypothetical protein N4A46_10285 [Schleiferiaceae bacterium]|nr:hypothetical protein [Schleiferiaceae bacterium]
MKKFFLVGFILSCYASYGHFGEILKSDKKLQNIENLKVYNIDQCEKQIELYLKQENIPKGIENWLKLSSAIIAQKKEDTYSATILVEELKLQDIEDPFLKAYLLYVDALLHIPIKNLAVSLEFALEAKEMFDALNEFQYAADCYSLLARIYTSLGQQNEAINALEASIHIHKSTRDSLRLAGDYHNLALALQGSFPDSINTLIRRAIRLNNNSGNTFWEANNHFILSTHLKSLNQDSLAFFEMTSAENLYTSVNLNHMALQSRLYKANMLFSDGLIDSAYTEYQNIIILNEEQNIGLDLESAFANLAEIEYRKGNLETYRSYSQRAKLISDSLLKLVNNNTISIIEIRNKYRFKQNELTLANERVKIKSRAKTIWIIVISSLLTLSLILAYIIYKSRKLVKDRGELNQLKLEQDLELKQKELTLSVMGQIKQNTTLDNLSDLIQKIDEEAPSRLKPKLQRAKRILKHDSKAELWKEFETRFTSVHADFYERLKNLGPELSPAEVKVCAFLKLGLNTKEIASLLHKTPASIEVDRSRIRKKLGLTSQEVNLTTFIQEI